MRINCDLPERICELQPTEIEEYFRTLIAEETKVISVYARSWRSSGAFQEPRAPSIEENIAADTAQRVLLWPTINEQPSPRFDDGRFCKSFPLLFPTCQADLHQPRIRADFSTADWAQHLIRHWSVFLLRGNTGQRALWAVFNSFFYRHILPNWGIGSQQSAVICFDER